MRYSEVHGHWPLMKPKKNSTSSSDGGSFEGMTVGEKVEGVKGGEKTLSSRIIEESV